MFYLCLLLSTNPTAEDNKQNIIIITAATIILNL